MDKESIKNRLDKILNNAPMLKEIIFSSDPIDIKRKKINKVLSDMLMATFDDNPAIPPLEWILTRDAIRVFRNILSTRNESLAGFSLLQYLNDLLYKENFEQIQIPGSGFFAELDHLIRGITGKTGVYTDKIPAFVKHKGKKAARMRSSNLSTMGKIAEKFIDRYPNGLDKDVIRKRNNNIARILKYFNATESDWENWKWHTRHIIRNANRLDSLVKITDEEYHAVKLARKYKIPFGITPYYLSLMDNDTSRNNDYAVRSQVIPGIDYIKKLKEKKENKESSLDFMLEQDTSPIEGITRRYPMIAILKPIMTCPQICVYCQRNWEIEDVYSRKAVLPKEKLENAIQWIAETPEIKEILITGGDPFLLSDTKIEELLLKLSHIKHIERIRIGTRTPVTLPMRITDSLIEKISNFHKPGKREILIVTHFEHSYEITPRTIEAIQKFRSTGITVNNQLVYTFYNSRKFEAVALRLNLRLIGVTPYYTFNTKGKEETDNFRVPIARLMQEQNEEARLLPGSVRTDEIVFNVPGLGKNYLRASQHHDVISILPNGRRVFEFHPWEKKLSLADTYVYTDVSIYDYLKRLKSIGENTAHYNTIWYYY
ncbi:MAG: KamA family radical SAM protein [Deltaproteobacteria bacterium]|nr:KamA family radical SAM protein [Deltaproteobacteria bacterium]MBW2166594.1 KamA family radical SAM protein [Deltaproteobacteria bacterium]